MKSVEISADATRALARAAGRSALWSFAQNSGKHILAFTVFILLARLLDPQAYGLMALATALIALATVFVEQGFGEALVQREHVDDAHFCTAFWMNLGAGAALAASGWLAADAAAALLRQPEAAGLIRWLSPLVLILALGSVHQAILQREMDFKALAVRTLVSISVGGATGVGLAFAGWGVWSLVGQQLAGGLTGLALLWASCSWRPRLTFSIARFGELWRFGRHVVGVRLVDFVNRKSDDLIVGYFLGPAALGIYNLGYQMLVVMEQFLCKGFDALALSAFSRLQGNRELLRKALFTAVELSALLAFPMFLGAIATAPELVAALLGERWAPSSRIIQILACVGMIHAVFHYNHAVFKACGRPALSLKLGLIEAIFNTAAFLVAVRWGVEAVAAAYAVRAYLLAPLALSAVRGLIPFETTDYLRRLAIPLLASVAMMATVVTVKWSVAVYFEAAVPVLLLVALGVAAYAAWLRILSPPLFRMVAGYARPANWRIGGAPSASGAV